jgi:hypothetical protein
MHTRAEFRLLVLFNALLIPAAMFVASYDALLLPAQLQAWLASRSLSLLSPLQSIAGTISFAAFAAICIGLLGMLMFWRWARALTLWGTVLIYLPMPLSGAAVLSGFAYTMDSVAAILWGVLLAAAYWSPVAAEFGPARSARSRGVAGWWPRRASRGAVTTALPPGAAQSAPPTEPLAAAPAGAIAPTPATADARASDGVR